MISLLRIMYRQLALNGIATHTAIPSLSKSRHSPIFIKEGFSLKDDSLTPLTKLAHSINVTIAEEVHVSPL